MYYLNCSYWFLYLFYIVNESSNSSGMKEETGIDHYKYCIFYILFFLWKYVLLDHLCQMYYVRCIFLISHILYFFNVNAMLPQIGSKLVVKLKKNFE